jgi:type IX secretion system PorP/SprF family membrane protein
MKKNIYILFFVLLSTLSFSQQVPRFSQYILNNYAINPAYAGSHQGLELKVGRRQQWIGMPFAPITNFMSAVYTIRPNYSYKGWHGLGTYIEQDNAGIFNNKSYFLSYAYHVRIFGSVKMGMGIGAGMRSVGISSVALGINDPVSQNLSKTFYHIPDFTSGIKIYSKKFFVDLSCKKFPLVNPTKNKVGEGNMDRPAIYLTYGEKFHTASNDFLLLPTLHMQVTLMDTKLFKKGSPFPRPTVDAGFMAYYRKRFGMGAQYRISNTVTGIVQFKIFRNSVLGISYDYSLGRMAKASPNSLEIILGLSPLISDEERFTPRDVSRCPDFDF